MLDRCCVDVHIIRKLAKMMMNRFQSLEQQQLRFLFSEGE